MRVNKARADGLEVLFGTLKRDSRGWPNYVQVGGTFVQHWIWEALGRLPAGKKVRIKIEVLD